MLFKMVKLNWRIFIAFSESVLGAFVLLQLQRSMRTWIMASFGLISFIDWSSVSMLTVRFTRSCFNDHKKHKYIFSWSHSRYCINVVATLLKFTVKDIKYH